MDIEKEQLKVNCTNCKRDIVIHFHTKQCPRCGISFNEEEIKNIFYNYQTQWINSKAYKTSRALENAGKGLESTGNCLTRLGCLIFFIPLVIFLIYFIFSIL